MENSINLNLNLLNIMMQRKKYIYTHKLEVFRKSCIHSKIFEQTKTINDLLLHAFG